ncbi:substrate-binding domain-containing protein [Nocardioides sp. C4-1]|uniref:sugar ABC transporter substrate-binding protein n=1 Tax=Nocardioides sp. C4-1 TaxID=3151851 RepID=UPI003266B58A
MGWNRGARLAALVGVGVLAFGSLAACGEDDGGSGTGSGSGGSSSGGDGGESAGKVGVILPDVTTSPRWEANDRPSLQKAFDDAGIDSIIDNAQGQTDTFGKICDSMLNQNVNVLMIVNLDPASGAACLKKAADAGVLGIDYDRLTPGGGAEYYVSFDNVKVGELMGEGLTSCLDAENKTKANIVYVNGDPKDNNAALFKQGYEQALAPKIDSGDYTLVGDQTGEWDATKAGTVFEQMYNENDGEIDGVVSANDTMAGGIIARLKANGAAGKIPVTGQDASIEGLQNILDGNQCMTVYKNTNLEAETAAKLAIALSQGDKEAADALATSSVPDPETGEDVPSALATPEIITIDSVKKVVSDGFADKAELCKGAYAQLCTANGVE